jgi:hypothetical protein
LNLKKERVKRFYKMDSKPMLLGLLKIKIILEEPGMLMAGQVVPFSGIPNV